MTAPLLEVRDLVTRYETGGFLRGPTRRVYAVNGVSFDLAPAETLGLVGESGSGKSTVGRTILRLTPATAGSVRFGGTDVLASEGAALRALRCRMQIVFQDPYSSLDPRMTLGRAVAEGIEIHRLFPPDEIEARVARLFEEVGLDPSYLARYPHECSGGQRQRIGIARALAVNPEFLICDEPVSALDVSVQAQVLNLLLDLQAEFGITYLLISHDLAVVDHICDEVAVIYLGRIVEQGRPEDLFRAAAHPYTRALLDAVPRAEPGALRRPRLTHSAHPARAAGSQIGTQIGSPQAATGCAFADRCAYAQARCLVEAPLLRAVQPGHRAACHHAERVLAAAPGA